MLSPQAAPAPSDSARVPTRNWRRWGDKTISGSTPWGSLDGKNWKGVLRCQNDDHSSACVCFWRRVRCFRLSHPDFHGDLRLRPVSRAYPNRSGCYLHSSDVQWRKLQICRLHRGRGWPHPAPRRLPRGVHLEDHRNQGGVALGCRFLWLGGCRSQIVSLQPLRIGQPKKITKSLKMLVARGVFAADPVVNRGKAHHHATLSQPLLHAASRDRDFFIQEGGERHG